MTNLCGIEGRTGPLRVAARMNCSCGGSCGKGLPGHAFADTAVACIETDAEKNRRGRRVPPGVTRESAPEQQRHATRDRHPRARVRSAANCLAHDALTRGRSKLENLRWLMRFASCLSTTRNSPACGAASSPTAGADGRSRRRGVERRAGDRLARRAGLRSLLLDISMPGKDGIALATELNQREHPPTIVFVTAHAERALDAFELNAVDYLTKPVRRERLHEALQRRARPCARPRGPRGRGGARRGAGHRRHRAGRVVRVPLHEVLYLKAELKYVTLRTANAPRARRGVERARVAAGRCLPACASQCARRTSSDA